MSKIREARKARLPEFVPPQLATLVSDVPTGAQWIHEIKLDGYRLLLRSTSRNSRLITRNGHDWTERFPVIAQAARDLGEAELLLDGEAVVLDEHGISRFQILQNAIKRHSADVKYYAFDLLHAGGYDLTAVPLIERKRLLARLLGRSNGVIRFADHVEGNGREFYEQACRSRLEGIISKRGDKPYRPGRGAEWLKVKCQQRQEFVIAGYTDPSGSRQFFGALVLGVYDLDGRLVFAGKVGTGFTVDALRDLFRRMKPHEQATPSVVNPPRGADSKEIHWLKPALVAEVTFTEWTEDGRVRHPSFEGLREDKTPHEVMRESPAPEPAAASKSMTARKVTARRVNDRGLQIAGIRLTNADRVLFPEQGVTKAGLARYWVRIADLAMPHLRDRPLTLLRCPSGRHKNCFYQKHHGEGMPERVPRISIREQDGIEPYMYIDGVPAIISLVQIGVLEFHVWNSRQPNVERPDQMVFDLDPDESLPWSVLLEAADALRTRLLDLELQNFIKTTGGKGLHIVVPIARRSTFGDVRDFAQAVAESFARADPALYTANMSKRGRKKKIFIDYLRNAYNSTAVAPWSPRAREGAPVSVPLSWDEVLESNAMPRYRIDDVPARLERLERDPWQEFFSIRQSITMAMKKSVGLR